MSYSLTLFPLLKGPRSLAETSVYCETVLVPGQNYQFYAKIDVYNFLASDIAVEIITEEIPSQLWVNLYGERGIQKIRRDSYGGVIRFAYAESFKRLVLPEDTDWQTKAVMAYVNALPNDTPILLYFS